MYQGKMLGRVKVWWIAESKVKVWWIAESKVVGKIKFAKSMDKFCYECNSYKNRNSKFFYCI